MSTRHYGENSERTTLFVLRGTLLASLFLGCLLILYNGFIHSLWLDKHTWIILAVFCYLFFAEFLLRKKFSNSANWMLILFYVLIAFFTLLSWGLNAPVGILTVSFAVILPSILIGPRSILPVTFLSILALFGVQSIHASSIISPDLQNLSLKSTYWDVIAYATILSVFALVSWIAGNQREKNLRRALTAEAELRIQKNAIEVKLANESAALRTSQLNQIRHLHKFALLGQSTAATIHELSNHLSILNLDIDDLRQQHSNSKAIANAKEGIDHINRMVRQARQQLSSYDTHEKFNALTIVHQCAKDLEGKIKVNGVSLTERTLGKTASFVTSGNPIALAQIVTILLKNAVDACCEAKFANVTLQTKTTGTHLFISVIDTGPGVHPDIAASLFNPINSTKNSGLGIGLFIAQHLAENHFNGRITTKPCKSGAHFLVSIPRVHAPTELINTETGTSRSSPQSHAQHSVVSR